jgi:hypothetical protein
MISAGGAAAGGRAVQHLLRYRVGDAAAGYDAVMTMSLVAVETGDGVADKRAERLGRASRIGRRRLRTRIMNSRRNVPQRSAALGCGGTVGGPGAGP